MQRFVKDDNLKDLLMEEILMESNTIKLFDKIKHVSPSYGSKHGIS